MGSRLERIRRMDGDTARLYAEELSHIHCKALVDWKRERERFETELSGRDRTVGLLTRQLDAAESARRYAIGAALDDSWCLDDARRQAEDAAALLVRRCGELATTRELLEFSHDIRGAEPYEMSPEVLCWMVSNQQRLSTPILHRGRELLHLIQALGILKAIPEATSFFGAVRLLDALQMVEEGRRQSVPEDDEIAAAIRQGEVA